MGEIVLETKQEPAKLRIYIGAAPGVGKTYHMLNDAHLMMHQQGVDIVIGLVETHGRKDTEPASATSKLSHSAKYPIAASA